MGSFGGKNPSERWTMYFSDEIRPVLIFAICASSHSSWKFYMFSLMLVLSSSSHSDPMMSSKIKSMGNIVSNFIWRGRYFSLVLRTSSSVWSVYGYYLAGYSITVLRWRKLSWVSTFRVHGMNQIANPPGEELLEKENEEGWWWWFYIISEFRMNYCFSTPKGYPCFKKCFQ